MAASLLSWVLRRRGPDRLQRRRLGIFVPIAYLIAAIVNAAFVAYLLTHAPRSQARRATAAVVSGLALWQFGEFAILVAGSPAIATSWVKFTYAVLIALPLAFLFFTMSFPLRRDGFWRRRSLPLVAVLPGAALACLLAGPWLIRGVQDTPWGLWRLPGPAFPLMQIYLPGYLLAALANLIWALRLTRSRVQKAQCWYVIGGVAVPVALGIVDLNVLQPAGIRGFHFLVMPLSGIVPTLAFTYALMRYQLFDIPGVLRSGLVQAALVALLLLPCLGIYVIAENVLQGSASGPRALLVAVLLVAAGFVFPRIKVAAHETLDQALFRKRWDYRRVLTATIREIATILEIRPLAATLTERSREALQVDEVTLWVRDEKHALYRPVKESAGAAQIWEGDARAIDRWIGGAAHDPWRAERVGEGDHELDQVLRNIGASICFGLNAKGRPLGVLALGPRSDGRPYRDDEVELLSTLANQVAVAVENARLYEALKESKQMLQRASRLSAVGTLAAGMAHEIRNPLVAVQTFLQILPERLDDPEVTGELRAVALGELQRVSKLITELLGMARSPVRSFEATDLDDAVAQVVRLLRVPAEKKQVDLRRTGDPLPTAYADASRLKQAMLNLTMNAIEATPPGTAVTIATRTGVDAAGRPFCQIEVQDQGPGIPAAHLEAIFHPFFTTKETGTGLGLAVTQQIVADHGGFIHVESLEGAGATFIIQVPLEQKPPDDIHPMPPVYGLGSEAATS